MMTDNFDENPDPPNDHVMTFIVKKVFICQPTSKPNKKNLLGKIFSYEFKFEKNSLYAKDFHLGKKLHLHFKRGIVSG